MGRILAPSPICTKFLETQYYETNPYDTLIGYTPLAHQPTRTLMLPSTIDRLSCITEARTAAKRLYEKRRTS